MDIQWDRQTATDRIRPACLVPGCSCKDPRIISSRRVAFFHVWATEHGETADRVIEPDPDWSLTPPPIRRNATIS